MRVLVRILEIVFPVFAVVAAGLLYGRRLRPDMAVVNRLTMDIFIPSLMFSVLSRQHVHPQEYAGLVAALILVILGSGLLAWPISRLLGLPARTLCPPMMFSNAANMGLPVLLLALGEKALPAAVVVILVENTLHFSIGAWLLDHRSHILRVLISPSMLASILGIVVGVYQIEVTATLLRPIDMLGQICVPLMLFSLGVRLGEVDLAEWRIGLLGAVLSPLLGIGMALLAMTVVDLNRQQQAALFLFGALPPAVLNFMFAEHYRQEPGRVASIVLMGNAFSVFSIPLALAWILPRYT